MRTLLLAALAAALSAAATRAQVAATEPAPPVASLPTIGFDDGELFPELELPMIDGSGTLKLSDLRGKKVLLIQFASW